MYQFLVKGVVQGVGFRPYIYNACTGAGLKGSVQNIGMGVEIVVDKKEELQQILKNIPPLARIDTVNITEISGKFDDFQIKESEGTGYAEVPPDLFLCKDCLRELRDPKDRRYGYFFITCTNCGPRFTITKETPYDRHTTSMEKFEMCAQCKEEYTDPGNRRYHAQTIACHDCGPKLKLYKEGKEAGDLKKAISLLQKGEVIAIKGVGGFHLACKIHSVTKLRSFTKRLHKPYALMCTDIEMVKRIAMPTTEEGKLLESVERPIVLVKKKEAESYQNISELDTFGIMLPYTALHYLLLDELQEPLVMTSANWSDEPITTERNAQFVPYVLEHDREIVNPADDSVIKVIGEEPFLLRRSRGFVPQSLPSSSNNILALGAEMNSAFCIVKEGKAMLSPYLGNTANEESFSRYKEVLEHFLAMTGTKPEIIVIDAHPSYNTSLYGRELAERFKAKLVKVQHHEAHVAAVAAEYDLNEYVGIAMDGLGYGSDGNIWGGEVFSVKNGHFERIGHLEEQPQLGGDTATQYPRKMLFGLLSKILSEKELLAKELFPKKEARLYLKMLKEMYNTPMTTSAGRILDAVAALLGICDERTYDGRPAMLLESVATKPLQLEPVIEEKDGKQILLTSPLFQFLLEQQGRATKGQLAATAQIYLAAGLHKIASIVAKENILCSGGVSYNRMITGYLQKEGILFPKKLPAGDGGICYGQAAIANLLSKNS